MEIKRIDEKTIGCFVSTEELTQANISPKDFIQGTPEAREYLYAILDKVKEAYFPEAFDTQGKTAITAALNPKGAIFYVFNDVPEEEIIERCNNLTRQISESLKYPREEENTITDFTDGYEKPSSEPLADSDEDNQKEDITPAAGKSKGKDTTTGLLFAFDQIRDVLACAEVLPKEQLTQNSLYACNRKYYIYVHPLSRNNPATAPNNHTKVCMILTEASTKLIKESAEMNHILEKGECLIAHNAIQRLQAQP